MNDLKGLGANVGPAVAYLWNPPSLLPAMLPWLAVLGLLLLKPNRTAHAWWIFVPLLIVFAVELGLRTAFAGSLPSEILDTLCQVALALAFGIAAMWLASPFLGNRSRFVTFLKMLLVQAAISLLAYAGGQDWGEIGGEVLAALIYLGVFVLTLVAALSLAGRSCRHRFHPVGLSLALLGWSAVCFAVISLPFAIFALIVSGGQVWVAFGVAILVSMAVQFALLLPFLVLSFSNNLYEERLRQLLGHKTPEAPPLLTPTPTPAPVT